MPKPKIEIDRRSLLCPQFKKPCAKHWSECAWAIEKDRVYPDGAIIVLKCCSVYLNADEHENSNNRLAMVQAEMGETKNAAIFQALALVGDPRGIAEINRMAKRLFLLSEPLRPASDRQQLTGKD